MFKGPNDDSMMVALMLSLGTILSVIVTSGILMLVEVLEAVAQTR